jgi:predicted NodU family carbamoyl transferase
MLVLGLTGNFSGEYTDLIPGIGRGFFHDAAACLIKDNVVVAAVEEERFNRIKKTTKFPVNAIRACLSTAGVRPPQIDAVGYYFGESTIDGSLMEVYLNNTSLPVRYSRDFISGHLATEFDLELPQDRLIFAEHHVAHALSCFTGSGMETALVVVMDARGERHSTTVFRAADGQLDSLATYGLSKSLGNFYGSAIRLLGYGMGDEYKVMGLAPYGNPEVYRDFFQSLYVLKEHGDYTLRPHTELLLSNGFVPRRRNEEFSQQHIDFAAGMQQMLEEIAMHVLAYWAEQSGQANLCFVGGVAHNSTLNGRILRSGLFRQVFIHPASHDAGAAEGAAVAVARQLGLGPGYTRARLRSASLGPDLGTTADIEAELASWSDLAGYERPEDIVERAAGLLADGFVLGWACGPSEYGPRALGNRSILADARPSANKQKINSMIKNREGYRPFAPVTTPQAAPAYFDLPGTLANYDFMSFVVDVREERRSELGAVTHVDGTARLQIIDPASNQRFHRLVERFGELTGTPVLLNTSFNNNAEPIVQSVHDVLTCFLTTELDFLVIGDFLVTRRAGRRLAVDNLVLEFRPVTRLARYLGRTPRGDYETRCEIYLDYAKAERAELSPDLYTMLAGADGTQTVESLAKAAGGLSDAMRQELYGLWQRRFIRLRPFG